MKTWSLRRSWSAQNVFLDLVFSEQKVIDLKRLENRWITNPLHSYDRQGKNYLPRSEILIYKPDGWAWMTWRWQHTWSTSPFLRLHLRHRSPSRPARVSFRRPVRKLVSKLVITVYTRFYCFDLSTKVLDKFLHVFFTTIQCDQIWQNFQSLGLFLRVYIQFGKFLGRLWQILYAIWKIFIDVNDKMLKNYLAIRSHCPHLLNVFGEKVTSIMGTNLKHLPGILINQV